MRSNRPERAQRRVEMLRIVGCGEGDDAFAPGQTVQLLQQRIDDRTPPIGVSAALAAIWIGPEVGPYLRSGITH